MSSYSSKIPTLDGEADNKTVIQTLEGKIRTPWQIQNVINDIQVCRNQGIQIIIKHVCKRPIWQLTGFPNLDTPLDTHSPPIHAFRRL